MGNYLSATVFNDAVSPCALVTCKTRNNRKQETKVKRTITVDFQKFALLEKAWKYTVIIFFHDFVGLVLHQTQCNFRQLRFGSNSAFFRFVDSLLRALNHAHTSKSLRTCYNPESTEQLRRRRERRLSPVTDVDLQKITAVCQIKKFTYLFPMLIKL